MRTFKVQKVPNGKVNRICLETTKRERERERKSL